MTDDILFKIIGKNIREERSKQRYTPRHLAEMIGKSYQTILFYETGRARINAVSLYKIAEALHIPVSVLFYGVDKARGD